MARSISPRLASLMHTHVTLEAQQLRMSSWLTGAPSTRTQASYWRPRSARPLHLEDVRPVRTVRTHLKAWRAIHRPAREASCVARIEGRQVAGDALRRSHGGIVRRVLGADDRFMHIARPGAAQSLVLCTRRRQRTALAGLSTS
jgi:hypothetical protein